MRSCVTTGSGRQCLNKGKVNPLPIGPNNTSWKLETIYIKLCRILLATGNDSTKRIRDKTWNGTQDFVEALSVANTQRGSVK